MLPSELPHKTPEDGDLLMVCAGDGDYYASKVRNVRAVLDAAAGLFAGPGIGSDAPYELQPGRSCYLVVVPEANFTLPRFFPITITFPLGSLLLFRALMYEDVPTIGSGYGNIGWDSFDYAFSGTLLQRNNVRWIMWERVGSADPIFIGGPNKDGVVLGYSETATFDAMTYYPVFSEALAYFDGAQLSYVTLALAASKGNGLMQLQITAEMTSFSGLTAYSFTGFSSGGKAYSYRSPILVHIERLI